MLELEFSPLMRVCQYPKIETNLCMRNIVITLDCQQGVLLLRIKL